MPKSSKSIAWSQIKCASYEFCSYHQDLSLQTSSHLLKTYTSVTSATAPITGNAYLKQAAATPLKVKLLMPMIHVPALPVSIWTKMKRKAYPLSEKRDCGSLMEPNLGARRTTKHVWKLQAEPQKVWRANHCTKHISACTRWTPKWSSKTRALCHPRGQYIPTLQFYLRNKVSFEIQPTNPKADITATGHCEYWITTIDLMEYQEKSTLSSPDDTMLPEVYTDTVACIYCHGKCKGVLTPERLHILQKAFDKVKCSGPHGHIKPPPISFASELVGLIACKYISTSKHANKKIRHFFPDTPLPHHRRLSKVGLSH